MVMQFNWLDILTLLIVALYAIDGLLKGFILSMFNLIGFFIAIYVARVVAPVFASYISQNTGIYSSVYKFVEPKLSIDPSASSVFNILGISKEGINGSVTNFIITIGSFVLVFLLLRLLLFVVSRLLDMAARLPVIKQFNKVGGLIFGVLKGVLVLYIVFAVLFLITPLISESSSVISLVDSSLIAKNFYRYNFIILWLNNFIH